MQTYQCFHRWLMLQFNRNNFYVYDGINKMQFTHKSNKMSRKNVNIIKKLLCFVVIMLCKILS